MDLSGCVLHLSCEISAVSVTESSVDLERSKIQYFMSATKKYYITVYLSNIKIAAPVAT